MKPSQEEATQEPPKSPREPEEMRQATDAGLQEATEGDAAKPKPVADPAAEQQLDAEPASKAQVSPGSRGRLGWKERPWAHRGRWSLASCEPDVKSSCTPPIA
jgi:hypothetical protein